MKVIVAKTAGFCKGVKDALEVTLEAVQKRKEGETICTYGPLIHNRQVLASLESEGILTEHRIEGCTGKTVVIRAHGIPPAERQALHGLGAHLVDATCKRVAKVHATIKHHARRGYNTVIVGDADHAEVIGLMGYTEGRGVVVNLPEAVDELPPDWEKVLLVAQTTQNEEIFHQIQERFQARYPNGVVKNTICGSTHERQSEVKELCNKTDAMVVVGGYHSGNTVRLAEIARESGVPTYHVETEQDLDPREMAKYTSVGVSAGASTPNWIIRNVVNFLEKLQPEAVQSGSGRRWHDFLAYSNLYVAVGAALLPLAVHSLTELPWTWAATGMAACYAYAMHSLNIYLDRNAIQLNDPGRASFYRHWRVVFTASSILAVSTSLWLAYTLSLASFLGMVVIVLLGLMYAVPLILPGWPEGVQIKSIPMSKTFSIPIAWAAVTVLVPNLSRLPRVGPELLYGFWIIFLLVLVRTVLLDLLAVQGDRLVGKETVVVLMGENRTGHFVTGILVLLGMSLLAGPALGVGTRFAWLILPIVLIYGRQVRATRNGPLLKEDTLFELSIEMPVIGVGLLGFLVSVI
jgi:4-hydroxy-3-methylbut-2-enyl diphosphate reductase